MKTTCTLTYQTTCITNNAIGMLYSVFINQVSVSQAVFYK